MINEGNIIKIAGPVIVADGMRGTQMYEVVRVGEAKLIGEIIELWRSIVCRTWTWCNGFHF